MSVLCKIIGHKFGKWRTVEDRLSKSGGLPLAGYALGRRHCERCGKVESQSRVYLLGERV